LYIYICSFITKILFFYIGDQLERYCASDIFYSSQAAFNCYLLPNSITEQTCVRHDVTTGLHCWEYWTKLLLYPQNGHMNKQTNIAPA